MLFHIRPTGKKMRQISYKNKIFYGGVKALRKALLYHIISYHIISYYIIRIFKIPFSSIIKFFFSD